MKVWVVEHLIDYSPGYIVGVYDTEKAARAVAEAQQAAQQAAGGSGDDFEVNEWQVDSVPHAPVADQETVDSDCWWLTCVGCTFSSGPYETKYQAMGAWIDHPPWAASETPSRRESGVSMTDYAFVVFEDYFDTRSIRVVFNDANVAKAWVRRAVDNEYRRDQQRQGWSVPVYSIERWALRDKHSDVETNPPNRCADEDVHLDVLYAAGSEQ